MSIITELFWFRVAGLGAVAVGMIATSRGEQLNAVWLVARRRDVHLRAGKP